MKKKVCDDHKILSFNAFWERTKTYYEGTRHCVGWTRLSLSVFGGNLIRRDFTSSYTIIFPYLSGATI